MVPAAVYYKGWTFPLSEDDSFVELELFSEMHSLRLTECLASPLTKSVITHLAARDLTPMYVDEGIHFLRMELLPLILVPEYMTSWTVEPSFPRDATSSLIDYKLSQAKKQMGSRNLMYISFRDRYSTANAKVVVAQTMYNKSLKRFETLSRTLNLISGFCNMAGKKVFNDVNCRFTRQILDSISNVVPEVVPVIQELVGIETGRKRGIIHMTKRNRRMRQLFRKLRYLRVALMSEMNLRSSNYRLLLSMFMINASHRHWHKYSEPSLSSKSDVIQVV